jgi:hypothetical protein
MSYSYDTRKKPAEQTETQDAAREQRATLQSGAASGAADGSGGRADLPEAMRARMADTFGDSLAGARAQGETARDGFLAGRAPEVRSERATNATQGAYAGPVTGAMSAAAPSAATAGPIQAKRKSAEEKQQDRRRRRWIREDEAEKAQQQAAGAALAQQRLDAGNIQMLNLERTWDEDHWGLGKRLKNWWSLKKSTGLSNRKSKIRERMNAEMDNMRTINKDEDDEPEVDDLDDEDNEVYD